MIFKQNSFFLLIIGFYLFLCINNSVARLPTSIIPIKYYLHISTNIHQDNLTYFGNVYIDISVNETTDKIILHSKNLEKLEIVLIDLQNDRQVKGLENEVNKDLLKIFSKENPLQLKAGDKYRLKINFVGGIQSESCGIFSSSYKDDNNQSVPLALTQFEPDCARSAFPCFDEPSFKAKFQINITHGSNYSAISNMPADGAPKQSANGEMKTTSFMETPNMSTYLLAFVVSDFKYITEASNGIEHRVFLPSNFYINVNNILKNSIKSVNALSNYLGIQYSLPKLDHILVDANVAFVAMENWGLITYEDRYFFFTNDKLITFERIISQNHEISHQWFGNLVTPKWWSNIWLSEGMSTYFSYITTDLIFPDENLMDFFYAEELHSVYNSRISSPLNDEADEQEIKNVFNRNPYNFGACVMNMFHHAIGHKTFIKGISIYLSKYQHSNVEDSDLFKSLQAAIDGDNVKIFQNTQQLPDVMGSWTQNQGFPVITVIRNYDNETITIQQKPYKKDSELKYWWIPLNFATAANPNFEITIPDYIMPPQNEVNINPKDFGINLLNHDWLIVNKQGTGLYSINYDFHNLELIAETLNKNHSKIHKYNRDQIIRDMVILFDENLSSIEPILNTLKYLKFEEDSLPWHSAVDLISKMHKKLKKSPLNEAFKMFVSDSIRHLFLEIFYSKNKLSLTDLLIKEKLYKLACEVNLDECLNYSKNLLMDFILNGTKIEDLEKEEAFCHGLKKTSLQEFKQLTDLIIKSNSENRIFYEYMASLKCLQSVEKMSYILKVVMGEDIPNMISKNDKMQYVGMLYVFNKTHRSITWQCLEKNNPEVAISVKGIASDYDKTEDAKYKRFNKEIEDKISIFLDSVRNYNNLVLDNISN